MKQLVKQRKLHLMLSFFLFTILLISCQKNESGNPSLQKYSNQAGMQAASKKLSEHLISKNTADEMMRRYDEEIGALIQDKFGSKNSGYLNTTAVVHDIDLLVEFLSRLKQKGQSQVIIRYAVADGDGVNGRIPGQPYHTVVFTNTGKESNNSLTETEVEYFNHGDLIPPYPECCPSGCNVNHTHKPKCKG